MDQCCLDINSKDINNSDERNKPKQLTFFRISSSLNNSDTEQQWIIFELRRIKLGKPLRIHIEIVTL